MKLSPVAQELLWLYLAQSDLVGSVRDFSIFLTRSVDEMADLLREYVAELRDAEAAPRDGEAPGGGGGGPGSANGLDPLEGVVAAG